LGAAIGCFLARLLGAEIMRKIFGVMLLVLGIWELFARHKPKEKKS
jgi:uncharacterized membrane protein YfcA